MNIDPQYLGNFSGYKEDILNRLNTAIEGLEATEAKKLINEIRQKKFRGKEGVLIFDTVMSSTRARPRAYASLKKKLVELADVLDSKGLRKEANEIDRIVNDIGPEYRALNIG